MGRIDISPHSVLDSDKPNRPADECTSKSGYDF
jgi:hypothetical protein